MIRRILVLLIAFPLGALLVTLAVANRHSVRLGLDPFRPDAPVLSLELPLFAYLFGTFVLGVLVGGAAVWLGQKRWRRTARTRGLDAARWKAEADRLQREREAVPGRKQLAAAQR